MPSSSHVPNASITVLLQALATPGSSFGVVTLLVDEDEGGPGTNALGGALYQDYTELADAQAARDAGEITVGTLAAATTAFSQSPVPSKFRVAKVDTGAAQTYSQALAALRNLGLTDLWMVCMAPRVAATQLALASTVNALNNAIALMLQVQDADWKTAGVPAAFAGAPESYQYVGAVYHDVDAEWEDVAAAVRALAWDPDETSAPWEGDLADVAVYTTYVTPAQRLLMIANNIGVLGTWGSTDSWIDNMVNFAGRPWYEVLSAAWYAARARERLQTMHQRESGRGRKILVDLGGMAQTLGVLGGLNADAERAGHFSPGQTVMTPQPITDADRTARRLRVEVEAMVGISARIFDVDAYFTETPVVTV